MLFLTLLVGVEEAHVAFASTPEHVVLTAESDSSVDSVLDLDCCTGNNVEIRVGCSAVHVAAVAKHVCCAPEVLDSGFVHLSLEVGNDFLHAAFVVVDVVEVADEVGVVEAEIFDAHLLHELETCVGLLLCDGHFVRTDVPREFL